MKTICDKCGAPIIEEDGKYLCSVCGKVYGDTDRERRERAAEDVRYAEFYQDVSLERFRQIAERLAGAVGGTTYPEIAVRSDGSYCVQKATDNSQYAARNWLDVERFYQPFYQQCYGLIGITADGQLEPTMIEMEEFFQELQEQGVSDMRMKDILVAEYEHTSTDTTYPHKEIHRESEFLGLDMRGKVVIFNPFKVLSLNKGRENDVKECGRVMQELRSWPPVVRLRKLRSVPRMSLCGITEDGKVLCTNHTERAAVQKWGGVADIVELEYGSPHCWVALKKDGTLLSNVSRESADEEANARTRIGKGWESFLGALDKLSGVVQIKARKISGGAALLYLTQSGELYQQDFKYGPEQIPPKLLAKNVVSLYSDGPSYIDANGHCYDGKGRKLSKVPLFHNILTLEEEWAQTEKRGHQCEQYMKAARKRLVELEKQRKLLQDVLNKKKQRLQNLETERDGLGFFKRKERQELDKWMEELRAGMEEDRKALSKLDVKIADCREEAEYPAVWKAGLRYEEPTWNPGGVDAAVLATNLTAQMRSSISGPPKKDKSVIGSAAVGGLVAGPTGAVVGAIYAADKNQRKKK